MAPRTEKTTEAGKLISALGGPALVGKALGLSTQAVWIMGERDFISPEYWRKLVACAKMSKVEGVTVESLLAMAERHALARPARAKVAK